MERQLELKEREIQQIIDRYEHLHSKLERAHDGDEHRSGLAVTRPVSRVLDWLVD